MRIPKHPTLLRSSRDARVKQLKATGPLLAGSLVQIAKHCGRPGCHCQTGEKHVGWYLTRYWRGKTKTIYVPLDMVEEVRSWIAEHRRLKRLMQEITSLSSALVQGHVAERQRRKRTSS